MQGNSGKACKEERRQAIEEFRKKRKEMKKRAHGTVKNHYAFLFIICLIMIIVGGEFSGSLSFFRVGSEERASSGSGVVARNNATEVLGDLVEGRAKQGDERAKRAVERYKHNTKEGQILGRKNGVLASLVNGAMSGSFFIQIISAIKNITHSTRVAAIVLIIIGLLMAAFFFIFIRNAIEVVGKRLFLEAKTYKKVPMHHMMWILSVHRWVRVSMTILVETILYLLWSLTIVGAIIKHYSYSQVAFIVAENPDIKPLEAITLSRKMMYGHKWERFKLDVTMLGWTILGSVTSGLADLFYVNQYRTCVECEYYEYIRDVAKTNDIDNSDKLNDTYLFEHAPKDKLESVYHDVEVESKYVEQNKMTLPAVKKFFVNNFGIWLGSSEEKKKYQAVEGRQYLIKREIDILAGEAYPTRLHPLADPKQAKLSGHVSFLRCYTVWSIVLMFFLFSFIGWLWEVGLHLVNDGTFVNRGMMHGPWLPIYGYGGTFILIFLTRLRKNPLAEFVGAIILSGFVEYMTSWSLEMSKGMLWWDYSGYFLNLNGRICAEGLLVFGVAGLLVVYVLAPINDDLIQRIPGKAAIAACVVLLALFGVDQVYSNKHPNVGEGITNEVSSDSTSNKRSSSYALQRISKYSGRVHGNADATGSRSAFTELRI